MHKKLGQNKASSHLNYWEVNNFYLWTISHILSLDSFKLVEDPSQISNVFIESHQKVTDKGHFFKVDAHNPEDLQ